MSYPNTTNSPGQSDDTTGKVSGEAPERILVTQASNLTSNNFRLHKGSITAKILRFIITRIFKRKLTKFVITRELVKSNDEEAYMANSTNKDLGR